MNILLHARPCYEDRRRSNVQTAHGSTWLFRSWGTGRSIQGYSHPRAGLLSSVVGYDHRPTWKSGRHSLREIR